MSNTVQLKTESVLQVPFEKYDKDFTFLVNSQTFQTSSVFADLLSPTISARHFQDPTMKEFSINTKNRGDFNTIIKLMTFEKQTIPNEDVPFVIEIFESLGTSHFDFNIKFEQEEELTIHNVAGKIKNHYQHPQFFKNQLDREIMYFSEHFYEMEDQIDELVSSDLEESTIFEDIINNSQLQLESEDQLLKTINKLYKKNPKYSYLYKYVDFVNVSQDSIIEFIGIFDANDMTGGFWAKIAERLEMDIKIDSNRQSNRKYIQKYIEFKPKGNEFDGIVKYLRTNSNVNDEISITASSSSGGQLSNLVNYDSASFFQTKSEKNSRICFEFKKHEIVPSNYLIRTINSEDNYHLKSWIVEASKDSKTWITIDEQQNNDFLKGTSKVHLFPISNQKESFKFVRIKQTGPSWYHNNDSDHHLLMTWIEFFGKLI
ncbi:hypothetical protein M9Y10_001454 [Tritrichomonas musculus]|uniref:F5/8 type C domain-containing protein n=1 Tax=Tritrichomonas musculus TaxID=1915356 RepID=A0ABR2L733_9EUKA